MWGCPTEGPVERWTFNGGVTMMESDLALVKDAQQGNAQAWEKLVRRHTQRIFTLCHRYAGKGDWAEDLTQETFLRIFRSLHQYRSDYGSFTNWIIRITQNLLIDHYRKNHWTERVVSTPAEVEEETGSVLDHLPSPHPCPHRQYEARENRQAIQQALKLLSPPLREAVILRYLRELSYEEMASVLRVSDGTVKSRISRGRQELARKLEMIRLTPQKACA
jgi:RNA polymerase sigma-70 factor, ECF subfamily